MTTHATSEKQWTQTELNGLPVEEQFRLRGLEVTRLDTFIDAAFAFVLTLLIISFDEIPSTYPELMLAVKRIPAFAFSFMIVMMFSASAHQPSLRSGEYADNSAKPGTCIRRAGLCVPAQNYFRGILLWHQWRLLSFEFPVSELFGTARNYRFLFPGFFYHVADSQLAISRRLAVRDFAGTESG